LGRYWGRPSAAERSAAVFGRPRKPPLPLPIARAGRRATARQIFFAADPHEGYTAIIVTAQPGKTREKRASVIRTAWPLVAAFVVAYVLADVPYLGHSHDSTTPCVVCFHHGLSADLPHSVVVHSAPSCLYLVAFEASSVDRFFVTTHHERAPPAFRR
jgi:hypothetical protein